MKVPPTAVLALLCACAAALPAPPPPPGSSLEWVELRTSDPHSAFYLLHEVTETWGDAWDKCMEIGGHLLILNSQEESEAVRLLLSDFPNVTYLHVGLHDLFKDGIYTTIFGKLMASTAFHWKTGEPNGGIEHCAFVNRDMEVGDSICSRMLPFICEKGP